MCGGDWGAITTVQLCRYKATHLWKIVKRIVMIIFNKKKQQEYCVQLVVCIEVNLLQH